MIRTSVVTVPADSYLFVTVDAVKSDLSISGGDADDWLESATARSSALISQAIGRTIHSETVVDTFSVHPGDHRRTCEALPLSRHPVSSVASVVRDGLTLVDGTDYRIDRHSGLLYLATPIVASGWSTVPVVVASYTGGYTTVPGDLEAVALRLVRTWWHSRDRDETVRSTSVDGIGAHTYVDPDKLQVDVYALPELDRYRDVGIG